MLAMVAFQGCLSMLPFQVAFQGCPSLLPNKLACQLLADVKRDT